MNLKNQGIGQLAHVVETPLRTGTFGSGNLRLLLGDPGLPYGGANSSDERDRYCSRRRDTCSMTVTNLPARYRHDPLLAITGSASRWCRMSSANCSRRRVPPRRLLAESHQHNVVEIACQAPLSFAGDPSRELLINSAATCST